MKRIVESDKFSNIIACLFANIRRPIISCVPKRAAKVLHDYTKIVADLIDDTCVRVMISYIIFPILDLLIPDTLVLENGVIVRAAFIVCHQVVAL